MIDRETTKEKRLVVGRVYRQHFLTILKHLKRVVLETYGERLVTLAVFGSVGRGTPRPDSDIDLLIIADFLPRGRMKRIAEFSLVEEKLAPLLEEMKKKGINTSLSPFFKQKSEVMRGSLLFLDMLDDALLLYDKNKFFTRYLHALREELNKSGARKVYRGGAWYWVLKSDYQPGEEFKI